MYISEGNKEFLSKIPFFIDQSPDDLEIISKITLLNKYKSGEVIFEENDSGDFICFLVEGNVEIIKKDRSGKNKTFHIIYPTSVLGEMALIDNNLRSATVKAKTDVLLGIIKRKDFEKVILQYPLIGVSILRKIAKLLSSRLRKTNNKIIEYL